MNIEIGTERGMTLEQFTLIEMIGVTNSPVDLKRTAYALRIAKQISPDLFAVVRTAALSGRADWRKRVGLSQRSWQAKVSRRPARGRNHDSWSIRERYVRCAA